MNTQEITAYLEKARQCAQRAAQTDDATRKLIYEELACPWRYLAKAQQLRAKAEKTLDVLSSDLDVLNSDNEQQRHH